MIRLQCQGKCSFSAKLFMMMRCIIFHFGFNFNEMGQLLYRGMVGSNVVTNAIHVYRQCGWVVAIMDEEEAFLSKTLLS